MPSSPLHFHKSWSDRPHLNSEISLPGISNTLSFCQWMAAETTTPRHCAATDYRVGCSDVLAQSFGFFVFRQFSFRPIFLSISPRSLYRLLFSPHFRMTGEALLRDKLNKVLQWRFFSIKAIKGKKKRFDLTSTIHWCNVQKTWKSDIYLTQRWANNLLITNKSSFR